MAVMLPKWYPQTNWHILTSLNIEGQIPKSFDQVTGHCEGSTVIQSLVYSASYHKKQPDVQMLIKRLLLNNSRKYMRNANIDAKNGHVNGLIRILKRIDYGQKLVSKSANFETYNLPF
ncbi:hypothetical protein PHYBLDRAFT_73277 [Phycomyces blakesleeanus NRRL 1555(-)]|uniref:Uncharacterized protein n=1 Tax=Phycomyces blakesleeanus (strain ATCC 8743b / DSM 1359 / FGSC 10004 / NBRC 33097 / NRRL 1555) TaxID=763407 RepID=A0A167JGW2_PHYB8|nr:hypothetical protein PHYBLDRAFT_73277 [Phycomyces blakesleeanus NRRL 1555(-)]OAD65949.1 hypothetical protein PHYBLDRAFT_73277 [Phycomyces blakesleeanus NRRL 1555(-)]|eukprot:XP_018283989.1 hypothetical protein PHYBLDRAFT_73277 [Phycomyces blakesleeanus NRRL 1555(-)]